MDCGIGDILVKTFLLPVTDSEMSVFNFYGI